MNREVGRRLRARKLSEACFREHGCGIGRRVVASQKRGVAQQPHHGRRHQHRRGRAESARDLEAPAEIAHGERGSAGRSVGGVAQIAALAGRGPEVGRVEDGQRGARSLDDNLALQDGGEALDVSLVALVGELP